MHDPEIEQIIRSRHSLQSKHYELKVIQDPEDCRAMVQREKSRGAKWSLDPPPVVELILNDGDPNRTYLQSPFWFCTASLEAVQSSAGGQQPKGLIGTTVSSLHKVKLTDSREERGFFIFGDLNICTPGTHQLKFSLFEMRQGQEGSHHMVAELLNSAQSRPFKVHPSKTQVHLRESTQLSKQLCDAGVKLRIRKETTNKRKPNPFEWATDRSQVSHPAIPSSSYTMGTGIYSHSENNHLRGSGSSYYMGNNPYSQIHTTNGGTNSVDQHDSGPVQHYNMPSYPTAVRMAPTRSYQHAFTTLGQ